MSSTYRGSNNLILVVLITLVLCCCVLINGARQDFITPNVDHVEEKDRLTPFYERIKKNDVKYCEDRTKLLPKCDMCIPGLQEGVDSKTCNEYIPSSKSIRDEIRKLVVQRYGTEMPKEREFGLYPCKYFAFVYLSLKCTSMCLTVFFFFFLRIDLEKRDFVYRHYKFGEMLSKRSITTLMDVGAYYNPINFFIDAKVCPENVIIVEPILDPLSVMVPCEGAEHAGKQTHVMFLPITFKYYMTIKDLVPMPETVVCIGCDSHYGPARRMLENAFKRPYSLFIEYPTEYVHNAPYRKMNGDGPGEKMVFVEKYQSQTNATIYTKRVMKVIDYTPV